jgi:hypothetical protein
VSSVVEEINRMGLVLLAANIDRAREKYLSALAVYQRCNELVEKGELMGVALEASCSSLDRASDILQTMHAEAASAVLRMRDEIVASKQKAPAADVWQATRALDGGE